MVGRRSLSCPGRRLHTGDSLFNTWFSVFTYLLKCSLSIAHIPPGWCLARAINFGARRRVFAHSYWAVDVEAFSAPCLQFPEKPGKSFPCPKTPNLAVPPPYSAAADGRYPRAPPLRLLHVLCYRSQMKSAWFWCLVFFRLLLFPP